MKAEHLESCVEFLKTIMRWRLVWLLGLACALKTEDCADCVQPERERYAPTWTLNLETREYKVLRFEINNFNAATCVHTSCDLRGEFVWGKFCIHFHLRWMKEARDCTLRWIAAWHEAWKLKIAWSAATCVKIIFVKTAYFLLCCLWQLETT